MMTSANRAATDDDWYIPNSDDETLETVDLTKEQILQYILELDQTGTLSLEWKCPGRRPPTPKKNQPPLPRPEATTGAGTISHISPAGTVSSTVVPPNSVPTKTKTSTSTAGSDYDFSDNFDKADSGATSGMGITHKKFGAVGGRKQKPKNGGGNGGASAVTMEKVMTDLIRQENEDKKNIDEDRIAKGLPTLSEEEQMNRRNREKIALETAANTVAINNALMGNNSASKKGGSNKFQTSAAADFNRTLENIVGGGATIIGTTGGGTNSFTSHSIANLGLAPADDITTNDVIPTSTFNLNLGALIGGVGAGAATDVAATVGAVNTTAAVMGSTFAAPGTTQLSPHFSSAAAQLQPQLINPGTFATALDGLTAVPPQLFPSTINTAALQASSLLSDANFTGAQVFGSANQFTGGVNSFTSVAALSNQFQLHHNQANQSQFFNAASANDNVLNQLTNIAASEALNLPNFSTENMTSSVDNSSVNENSNLTF